MTNKGWFLVATSAQLLPPEDREAVLGDMAEAGESVWRGLADVLSLVLYRQAALWKSWRPWLAGFGLTMPNSFLLMGTSVSVSQTFLQLTRHRARDGGPPGTLHDLVYLLCQIIVLVACSWTGGLAVASLSRRTLWTSAWLCVLPCLDCLATFRIESLSGASLLLFLPPAILGGRRSARIGRISPAFSILLATAITISTIPTLSSGGFRIITGCALLWPAWYLVALTSGSGNNTNPGEASGAKKDSTT